jgi:ubiquinone/menaquinone biosynthesis C-methylase UbiE
VLFTNAKNLGFASGLFDRAISGFMGWYDCFDFSKRQFTQPDTKAKEIWRVLKDEGILVCCSWENQEDLAWMEDAIVRHYPAILNDREYLRRRPIGMAYEKADGYEIILQSAGFRNISIAREGNEFVSTDEEEWWRQMRNVGWASLLDTIERKEMDQLQKVKEAIFKDLQQYKRADGICFSKTVFFVWGTKS